MAVALTPPERLEPIAGLSLSVLAAGIRYVGRDDLVLMVGAPGTVTAALFTQNAFCAAPVQVAKAHLAAGAPRLLLINAGNANAGTGVAGLDAAQASCVALGRLFGESAESVLPFSTGVIGEPLPLQKILTALPFLKEHLAEDRWMAAARAIMTTDTVLKGVSQQIRLSGGTITVTGMAKGSGMIHPDMATMLAFIGTDLRLEQAELQTLLAEAVADSFNAITVDGDTSTNDAVVCMATGASAVSLADATDRAHFAAGLQAVCLTLAQAIVRDGEGATKFIRIQVQQAREVQEARRVAEAVALSPLVKTALFASDPNWGRILAAVGRAGVAELDISRVTLEVNSVVIVRAGGRALEYTEAAGQQAFGQDELLIRIHLGRGVATYTKYTCDFSYDYVRINADYRS